jgi:hypothetical protein
VADFNGAMLEQYDQVIVRMSLRPGAQGGRCAVVGERHPDAAVARRATRDTVVVEGLISLGR